MSNNLEEEIRDVLSKMDNNESQDNSQQTPSDEIQDVYVFVVRERDDEIVDNPQVVDSTPVPVTTQQDSFLSAYIFVCFSLFLILSILTFQLYSMFNPQIATITLIPKSQQLTLNGTLQLGRLLPQLTLSQTATTPTTGHGHQDAKNATGTVTFFNGLFTQQFIASGTVYTGNDGVEIVTMQDATIPPGSPSTGYGTLTVTAQALLAGTKGNISAGDIDIAINNGLLVRNSQFYNGQDERNFQTVSKNDIDRAASPLKATLAQSMSGALEGQLKPSEQLSILPCSPIISPNHRVGDEAIQVKVTVSETCSAAAYNSHTLTEKARGLLTAQAQKKLAGYSLFDGVTVKTVQTSITHNLVFLSFKATGTWVYGLTPTAQERIKNLITGKTTDQALQILAAMPGIERGSIQWGDDTKLPKDSRYIHIILFVS